MAIKRIPLGFRGLRNMCCGCGDPTTFYRAAFDALSYFESDHGARDYDWPYSTPAVYFLCNVMDYLCLVDHGTSLAGGWLTQSGKDVIAFMRGHEWNDAHSFEDD